jgi:subtilisin family serine protease
MHLIEDQIRSIYYNSNIPGGVLFLGAAGTDFCLFGLAFPGYLPEVVTVAGVAQDRHTPSNGSCSGGAVDIAAIVGNGDVETTGLSSDEIVGLGGSSGATATIASIAALIWSRYPTWNRDQVRDRLFASGQGYRDSEIGYGVADAYKGVGGFSRLWISGPERYTPGRPYSLRADTGFGDGPFTYQWSTGETTPTISRVPPGGRASQTTTLTVTDTFEQRSLTQSITVRPEREPVDPPCRPHCP